MGLEGLLLTVDLFVEGLVVGDRVTHVLDLVIFELLDHLVQGGVYLLLDNHEGVTDVDTCLTDTPVLVLEVLG